MTGKDKELLYNLIKTASQSFNGYTRPGFPEETPDFKDDCEPQAVQPQITASPAEPKKEIPHQETSSNSVSLTSVANTSKENITEDQKKGFSMDLICRKIFACNRCDLSKSKNNCVPGTGVITPLVLVIGDAPSAQDDLAGLPFTDQAGNLLDKMLAAISLSRNQNAFLTNLVKCKPSISKTPTLNQVGACISFLDAQISVLKPKMILTLGENTAQAVLRTRQSLNALHGEFFDYQNIPVMPIHHPDNILRNQSLKAPVWDSLKLFKSRLLELQPHYDLQFKKEM